MKKNIISLFLLIFVDYAVASVALASTELSATEVKCPTDNSYKAISAKVQDSLLYSIHNCENGAVSYVFGTFHTSNAEILQSISYVKPHLATAKQAWFEIDLKAQNDEELQKMMLLPAGSKGLKHEIGANYFAKMIKLFQRKANASPTSPNAPTSPNEFINRLKPWAAAITLQVLDIEIDGMVMDDMLQQYASENKIEVMALETARDQLYIFDNLSSAEQLVLLKEAIDNYGLMAGLSKKMMMHYQKGHLHNVALVADEAMKLSDAPVNAKLEDRLINKRNLKMAEKLKPHLNDSIFIAVGALHLTGETGLLQQFENAGYGVYVEKPSVSVGK